MFWDKYQISHQRFTDHRRHLNIHCYQVSATIISSKCIKHIFFQMSKTYIVQMTKTYIVQMSKIYIVQMTKQIVHMSKTLFVQMSKTYFVPISQISFSKCLKHAYIVQMSKTWTSKKGKADLPWSCLALPQPLPHPLQVGVVDIHHYMQR